MTEQAQEPLPQTIDLKSLSINDLKALVYDAAAKVQAIQKEIAVVNEEISKRVSAEKK